MSQNFFITAIGTEIGKTFVTAALAHQLHTAGQQVRALKPIISGFGLGPCDSTHLLEAQGLDVNDAAIAAISPWRFTAPLSPHLAAAHSNSVIPAQAGIQPDCPSGKESPDGLIGLLDYRFRGNDEGEIDTAELLAWCRAQSQSDVTALIEGVGGLMVPLNWDYLLIDWIAELGWPVLLVASNYLGAINHTLLSLEALHRRSIAVQAVMVSECPDSPVSLQDTADSIAAFMPTPAPIHLLPRVDGGDSAWKRAPNLLSILN